jgi:putative membrane protein
MRIVGSDLCVRPAEEFLSMRILSFIVILIVLILGVTFAVMNAQPVSINYYLNISKIPLSLLLVLVLGVGGFIGWLTGLWMWLRLKTENFRLGHRIKTLEKELDQLRTQPVNET